MVAYSFHKRFWKPIQRGEKSQAVRGHRKRHVQVGGRLGVFYGLGTRQCWKLIPDPVCVSIEQFEIQLSGQNILRIAIDGVALAPEQFDPFARQDGFKDAKDMASFRAAIHGDRPFNGLLIKWKNEGRLDPDGRVFLTLDQVYSER